MVQGQRMHLGYVSIKGQITCVTSRASTSKELHADMASFWTRATGR
jgi:hypothetical protein